MTTIHRHVASARMRLVQAGLDLEQARVDAEVLARNALGWDRATYLSEGRAPASADFSRRYEAVVARRERREPVSLITGHREFWGLLFDVSVDVLTPRPETELVLEAALSRLQRLEYSKPRVVDVGTGSGCLAVSLAREFAEMTITAVDVSEKALTIAQRNAVRHGVSDRIHWVCAPFLEGISRDATLDLVVANLPYVPDAELASLPPEVREYEPRLALAGGTDGLDKILTLVDQTADRLSLGGALVLECGVGQKGPITHHVAAVAGLEVVGVHDDLQGVPRVVVAERH